MRRPVIYIITVFFTVVVFCSCGRRPRYVISEDKMMEVLFDIRLAQAIYGNNTQFYSDSAKDALIAGVLEKYDITQAQLDTSLIWYADNIEQYRIINDSVSSRLKAKSNLVMTQKSKMDMSSSQKDYLIPPFFYLNQFTSTLRFEVDSFKIKTIASSFLLSFDVQGLSPSQRVDAALYFTYKDTLVRNFYDIDKNKRYVISKPQLPDSLLKSISGYIHVDSKTISNQVVLYNISYSDSTAVKNNATPLSSKSEKPADHPVKTEVLQRNEPLKTDTLKEIDPALMRKRITR